MVQALPKAKVTYHDKNLSALAIVNVASCLESRVVVEAAKKPNIDRNAFYHVDLKAGQDTIYGELSILDYIVADKNRETGGSINMQGRGDLVFDDWVGVLNRRLRPATNSFSITKDGADVKETIKNVAKALEEQGILDRLTAENESNPMVDVYLAALTYTYLESAQKLLNKRV